MTTKDLCNQSLIPIIHNDEDGDPEEYVTCVKMSGMKRGMAEILTLKKHNMLNDEDIYAVYELKQMYKEDYNLNKVNLKL